MSEVAKLGIATVAKRYADAMIDIGQKHDLLTKIKEDFHFLEDTIVENKDLKSFLEHPVVHADCKKEVLDKIFGEYVSPYVLNVLKILLDRNRFVIFHSLINIYEEEYNKIMKISVAQVTTAVEINDEVKGKLIAKLEAMLNNKVYVTHRIDETIIAGMVVRIGNKIIDGSVKTKLETMKKQLI